jgi:hypothetical protein
MPRYLLTLSFRGGIPYSDLNGSSDTEEATYCENEVFLPLDELARLQPETVATVSRAIAKLTK